MALKNDEIGAIRYIATPLRTRADVNGNSRVCVVIYRSDGTFKAAADCALIGPRVAAEAVVGSVGYCNMVILPEIKVTPGQYRDALKGRL